jgi:hypothetical protein
VQVADLTPRSPSYYGNRSIRSLEGILPADWLSGHDFSDDEVEVYGLGDAVVLLPNRRPKHELGPDFSSRLTAGWGPVEWWTLD